MLNRHRTVLYLHHALYIHSDCLLIQLSLCRCSYSHEISLNHLLTCSNLQWHCKTQFCNCNNCHSQTHGCATNVKECKQFLSLSPACEIPYSQQICILRPTSYTTVTTDARTALEMENRVFLLNGYEPLQITFLICLNFKNSVTAQ